VRVIDVMRAMRAIHVTRCIHVVRSTGATQGMRASVRVLWTR
jgi:hypothetical protein